ncbi:GroES-like protein [Calocera cornea HHB12733]|uniref:GroES-like protein n=1 Tax=Calocera cornea HHB12733 TaxID=1353952 RepID=A0A165I6Q5_9BASI|nr:GroES-like protein [Calocera cornea HHB12733]
MADDTLMRALIQTAYGPPAKSLTLQHIPKPVLPASSSSLLVRVKAASIAPAEWGFLIGITRILGVFSIPDGMGIDFAGVVEGAGEGAKALGWKEGEEIVGAVPISRKGVYQEYILVEATDCARKPANLSWEEASCLPANGLTALQAIAKHKGAKESIFITGGMGGVGHLAIQLAHYHFGFKHITTTVSTSKVVQLKELYPYVDEVIDYKTTDPLKVIPKRSLDVVFSTLGTPGQWIPYLAPQRPVPSLIEITTSPGTAVIEQNWGVKFPWYGRLLFNVATWWMRPRVPEGVQWVPHNTLMVQKELETLVQEAAEGHLTPLVGKVFTLEQATEAFELAHKGIVGKVVFRVTE